MGATFIFYVAIMRLKSEWDSLPKRLKILLTPWVIVGVLLDFVLSQLMTPIIGGLNPLKWQFAWLLSKQLKKHKARSKGRSLRLSNEIGGWLNIFDKGHY